MSGKRQRGKMRARDHPLFGPYSGRGQISFPSDLLRQILALSSPEEQEQESEEDEKDEGLTRLKNASTRANKVDDFDKNIEPHIEDLSADEQVGNDRTDRKREEIKSRQSYRRQCSISTKKSQTSKSTEFQATIISKRKRESPVARRHTKVLSKWKPRLTEREKCPKKKKKAFETSTATTGTKKIFQVLHELTKREKISRRAYVQTCSSNRKLTRTIAYHRVIMVCMCPVSLSTRRCCAAFTSKKYGAIP